MNEAYQFLSQVLGLNQTHAPLQEIIFALGLSFTLNFLIALTYKTTFKGGDFSQDYVHSLLILGTTVSVVVMVVRIGPTPAEAQATAFGIFAAFSIIRFRTTV